MLDLSFYKGKKVFLTGHTGFKGSWMSRILVNAGAELTGYSLHPTTDANLFSLAGVEDKMNSISGDVRDPDALFKAFSDAKPEIVIHMAAQPIVREGYRACKLCKARNLSVCITVVHSMMQALMAAKAGADYTAPYISHIDNIGADGVHCVDEIVKAFNRSGYKCKVLGASFRTVEQVDKLAIVGCHAVTITPETFDMLIAHPSTDVSMKGFDSAWHDRYGERQVTYFLPE